jgi:hypothetical protein
MIEEKFTPPTSLVKDSVSRKPWTVPEIDEAPIAAVTAKSSDVIESPIVCAKNGS